MTTTNPELMTLETPLGRRVGLGLIGFGTVGTGVYKRLSAHPELDIRKIAVRDMHKSRSVTDVSPDLLTANAFDVVRDDTVEVVVEVMGGADLARELITEALQRKKHVVTANKELIAKHGPELFELAKANNVRLLFEGAVAGGIPIIMPMKLSLAANRIQEIAGILNGTTNYILTKMTEEGWTFEKALQEAQALGFAEADPTNDVEGYDTAYKIAILSSIAFKKRIEMSSLYCKGITSIAPVDIEHARTFGYVIKLVGLAREAEDGMVDIRVHPMLVPDHHPLANVFNEFNAICVRGDAVGDVMFYGRGAGEMPTASAVMGDVLAITNDLVNGNDPIPAMQIEYHGVANLQPILETRNKYYIRLNTTDLPGVIGRLGTACGDFNVSLESVMQRSTNPDGTASIVLVTHEVGERQMQGALEQMVAQESTQGIGCVLRILG